MSAMKLSEEYLTLIKRFPLVPIRNRRQFEDAVVLMKELTSPRRLTTLTSSESDYLDVLADLTAKYERIHFKPLARSMTSAEALGYLLEQSGTSQSELAQKTSTQQSHISEFLAGKRDLSKASMVKIARFFNVSLELFLSGMD